jgi:hypothetical protein
VASGRKVTGLRFDEIYDCALIQFCESVKAFRPGSNNGLMAYLIKAVDGAISDAQHEWQRKGFTGLDTRLRRFLRNEENRNLPLEQIQKRFPKYTLEQIEQALRPIVMQSYDEGGVDDENGYQEADEHNAPSGYAIAKASGDPINAQRSTSSQWSKRAALGPAPGDVIATETVDSARQGLGGVWSYRRKRVYGSPWIDSLERRTAIYEARLLKAVGRQRFTEWRMQHRSAANTGDLTFYCDPVPRAGPSLHELEARETACQTWASLWNDRARRYFPRHNPKLERWLEDRDSGLRGKYSGLAGVDEWLRADSRRAADKIDRAQHFKATAETTVREKSKVTA